MAHRQACALILVCGLLLPPLPALAQPIVGFPANAGFESGLDGWTVLAPEGAAVAGPAPGSVGGTALSLRDGWVISAPPDEPLAGWIALSLRARPPAGSGRGRLLVALAATADRPPPALAALPAQAFGGQWRPARVEALVPAGTAPCIALGVEGQEPWLIDALEVQRITVPSSAEPHPAVIPDDLPPDWQPDGLLDARARTIANKRELLLFAGSMEISIPEAAEAPRGQRGALRVMVTNRSAIDRELTVAVAGRRGLFVPERTVTVRGGVTTVFDASLQCFLIGETVARVTFRSGGDEASAPVRLTTSPAFPAAGLTWLSAPPSPAELAAVAPLDAQLHAVLVPALEAASARLSLPEGVTRMVLLGAPWTEDAVQFAARGLSAGADALAIYPLRGETASGDPAALTAALGGFAGGFVVGPPLDLMAGSPPSLPQAAGELAQRLAAAGGIAAQSVRTPVLRAGAVREVTVARQSLCAAQPCWTELACALRLEESAAAIRAGAAMPLLFPELLAAPSGSPEVDALVMARTLVACAYQGATGFALTARASDCPPGADAWAVLDTRGALRPVLAEAWAELARELAGVVPLRVYVQTPEIGLADDARVGFRPFMRGDEGLLALWNNTGAQVELIVETRTQPLDVHTVSVGPGGVQRGYVGAFHYDERAIALNRPVLFVSLEPGQLKLLSMQLARPHPGWLATVEFAPPIPRERQGPPNFFDAWDQRRTVR
ncbi:MAG: hypothetical protein AB7Y46_00205 [Armatimonadota bacterium]